MQFLHDEQGRQQTAHIAAHIKRPLHAADELPAGTRFGAVVKFGILPEPRENVRRFEGRAQGGESGVGLCFVPAAQAVGNKAEQGRAVEGMKRARRGGQDGERGEKIEAQLVARRVGAFFLQGGKGAFAHLARPEQSEVAGGIVQPEAHAVQKGPAFFGGSRGEDKLQLIERAFAHGSFQAGKGVEEVFRVA